MVLLNTIAHTHYHTHRHRTNYEPHTHTYGRQVKSSTLFEIFWHHTIINKHISLTKIEMYLCFFFSLYAKTLECFASL